MKVLFITYDIGTTASGIISQRVVEGLIAQDHEIVVITSSSSKLYDNAQVVCIKPIIRPDSFVCKIINKARAILGVDVFNCNNIWRLRARRMIYKYMRSCKPDVIYCRTSPIDPCFVGIWAKEKYNIPLVTNLTDPLPAPVEYLSDSHIRTKRKRAAQEIINASDLISMGTVEALNYQINEVGIDFSSKAFISPDPVPNCGIKSEAVRRKENIELLYLGAIYGSRNIFPLLDAVNLLREKGFPVIVRVCGILPSGIKYKYLVKDKSVSFIDDKLANADILIDIDGDDKVPIFISSKLKQYLICNRPILSITPIMSPSYKLLKGLRTVKVVNNDVNEICNAILYLIQERELFDYKEREEIVAHFSIDKVVANLIYNIETRLLNNI